MGSSDPATYDTSSTEPGVDLSSASCIDTESCR
jgi:hypothetical protein